MKKISRILMCVTLSLSMLLGTNIVYAADSVVNESVHNRIVALYAEREELAVNWEENENRINEIDALVAELGVTAATDEDLAKLCGTNNSRVTVLGAFYGSKITQERYVTNYNGRMMELQIIRVVPAGAYGNMYHSAITDEKKITTSNAAANVFFKCVVPAGLGFVPEVGAPISVMITGAQVLMQMNAELNCTTLETNAYYDYTATSSEVWIYVKHQGSTDDTQKLCYNGNSIHYEGRYICKGLKFQGSTPQFTRYGDVISGYVKSPNYDNCETKAKNNFFNYTNYNTSINPDEHVLNINITMNNKVYNVVFTKTGFSMIF